MAFIDSFPAPRSRALLGFRRDLANYPFDYLNNYEPMQLLNVLSSYCSKELPEDYAIQPLDFTRYLLRHLEDHFNAGTEWGPKPLYFFHHWIAHPNKATPDLTQRSWFGALENCYWKSTGSSKDFIYGPGFVGSRKIYTLFHKLADNPREHKTEYQIELYYLDPPAYQSHETPEHKKTDWALVKLTRGQGYVGRGRTEPWRGLRSRSRGGRSSSRGGRRGGRS